jgi:hypothetical protein
LWEKNVFLVENFAFFLYFRKFAKFSMPKHGKRNHDLDVECKSQGVFLQFWMFTFLSFQGRNIFFLLQFLLLYLLWHGQSIKYSCPTWKEGWTSLVLSHIGYLTDNNVKKHIQNTMLI